MLTVTLILLVVIAAAAIFLRGRYNEAYWKKRGVPFYAHNKAAGVFYDFLKGDRGLTDLVEELYNQFPDAPAVGTGSLFAPNLIVTDPTNVQFMMTTNFNCFMDRSIAPNTNDTLSNSLTFITGAKWKLVRQSMTPLFTSTKLKSMYYIMDKSARDFVPYIKNNPKLKRGDAFTTLSTFCSAAIGAAVFGISTESVFDSPFLKMTQSASFNTMWQNLKLFIAISSSFLSRLFNLKLFAESEDFFISAMKQVIYERKKTDVKRHDYADLCVALQEKGVLKDNDTGYEIRPTDELLSAQAFFFFNAGVEPTATVMFHTLVLIGQHPEVQLRLHQEIDEAFEKCGGNVTFDVISDMEYLDMVINESMRIHPAIGFTARRCVKSTTLPVGDIKVDEGTFLLIPLFSFQRDERYYPEAHVFKPERFARENKTPIMDKTFMPFGKGNRNCIGQRFATIQIKAGLVYLLRNFKVNTLLQPGKKIGYKKMLLAVKLVNVDVEFIDR